MTEPLERHEIVVVGAGPAGIRAAVEASAVGAEVLVLDEAPWPGGQIYRQLPPEIRPGTRDPLGGGPGRRAPFSPTSHARASPSGPASRCGAPSRSACSSRTRVGAPW